MSKRRRRVDYWHDPAAPTPTRRPPSVTVLVRDGDGRVLMVRRADNGLWSIPGGKLELGETIAECGRREVEEETGVRVEVTGLVGVFSDPGHVIAYYARKSGKLKQVREPVNVCVHARPVGGQLHGAPREVTEVGWYTVEQVAAMEIHPAIRARIDQGLGGGPPHLG